MSFSVPARWRLYLQWKRRLGVRQGLLTAKAAVQAVPELRVRRADFQHIKTFYNCNRKDKQLQR